MQHPTAHFVKEKTYSWRQRPLLMQAINGRAPMALIHYKEVRFERMLSRVCQASTS